MIIYQRWQVFVRAAIGSINEALSSAVNIGGGQ